jgi:hypothetical protein
MFLLLRVGLNSWRILHSDEYEVCVQIPQEHFLVQLSKSK